MIDLHSHIVPGFDDGARSMEDALEMARMAADSGVTILAATSHGNLSQGDPGACLRDYRKRLAMLRREVRLAGIRLKLAGGMEILLTGETLRYAERHRLPGLRGGNWILAEFVFDIPQARARKRLEFLDRQGYQVILAHPERYCSCRSTRGACWGTLEAGPAGPRTGYSAGGWRGSSLRTPTTRCSARRT